MSILKSGIALFVWVDSFALGINTPIHAQDQKYPMSDDEVNEVAGSCIARYAKTFHWMCAPRRHVRCGGS